jgi:hypothetical protein
MTKDLQQHLKNNPQIETVFVNGDNEWQFHKRKGFDKELSRAEVLKMKVADTAPAVAKESPAAPAVPTADSLAEIKAQLKAEVLAEIAADKAKEKEVTDKAAAEKAKAETQKA